MEINTEIAPEEIDSKYKRQDGTFPKKYVYTLTNGKKVTVPSGLDRGIIDELIKGNNKITVIKIGEKEQTRYQVVPS